MNFPISLPKERWPDLTHVVTEDDTPVDNPFSEKEMRLLTSPLYATWSGPSGGRPFRVLANVGLFNLELVPIVPDVMLGLDVECPLDLMIKGHRAWFIHIVGKSPDVAIEIVSARDGGEDTTKMIDYAALGIRYYIIHDPRNRLGKGVLRGFELRRKKYVPIDPRWLPKVELGLILWQGKFEGVEELWLRWCDKEGNVILTGEERAEKENEARLAAEQEKAAAELARNAAEQDKAAAEHGKAAAEQGKAAAEQAKAAAEQAKAAAEQAKAAAEQDKAAAEQDKAAAEQDKAAAEQDKAAAEQDKAAAEQARIAAEEKAARLAQRLRDLGLDAE